MSKRMMMKRAAPLTLRSITGHTVRFEADKPVPVPAEVIREAMDKGAVPVDGDVSAEPEITDNTPVDPNGPERRDIIQGVLEVMKLENNRDDFTSGGVPAVQKVSERAKFKVDAREIKEIWEELLAEGDD